MKLKKLALQALEGFGLLAFVSYLVLLAMSVEVLLMQPTHELLGDTLGKLERQGVIIYLWITGIIVPIVSSVAVIGFLGGMIGGMFKTKRLYIGFIIGSIVALVDMTLLIERNLFEYSLGRFFLMSAPIPIYILFGGITYHIICKWRINKRIVLGK